MSFFMVGMNTLDMFYSHRPLMAGLNTSVERQELDEMIRLLFLLR